MGPGDRPKAPPGPARRARPRARVRRRRSARPLGARGGIGRPRRRPRPVSGDDRPHRGPAAACRTRRAGGPGHRRRDLHPLRRRIIRRRVHVVHPRAVRHVRDSARSRRVPACPPAGGPHRRRVPLARRPGALAHAHSTSWLHDEFPATLDCRPIHGRRHSRPSGFERARSKLVPLWGLRAEAVVAVRPIAAPQALGQEIRR